MSKIPKLSHGFTYILEDLASRDIEKKIWAIIALGIVGSPEHADKLTDFLASPDESVVKATLETLGKLRNPSSIKYIIELLSTEKSNLVENAISALSNFDSKVILDSVLKALHTDHPGQIKRRLLTLIATVKDPRVAATMAELLQQSQDPGLIQEALSFFSRYPDPQRIHLIKPHSTSGQWEISMLANIALSRLNDQTADAQLKKMAKSPAHPLRLALINNLNKFPAIQDRPLYELLLKDSHPQIRLLALQGLSLFSRSEREDLLLEMYQRERDETIKVEILKIAIKEAYLKFYSEFLNLISDVTKTKKELGRQGLLALGNEVKQRLIQDFQHGSTITREQLVIVLGNIGGDDIRKLLLNTLSSKERWLKINSITALSKIKDTEIALNFIKMLETEEDVWTRATLCSALGTIGDERAIPILVENLKHKDARVRANAVESLGMFGNKNVRANLEPLLRDPNDRVRVNCAISLFKLGDESVIPTLLKMTDDPSKWMKASASFALGEIGDSQATPKLLELLSSSEDIVYKNALEALVKIADIRAIIPLLKEKNKKRLPEEVFAEYINKFQQNWREKTQPNRLSVKS